MIIHLDFEELLTYLGDMSVVINDSLSDEEVKNITFQIKDDNVYLIGQNKFISYKIKLNKATISNKDRDIFQIRCRELINYLGVYKNLTVTNIKNMYFELLEGNKILCNITEESKYDSSKTCTSRYTFENVPVKHGLDTLDTDLDSLDYKEIDVSILKKYTTGVGTLLQAKANLYGNLVFDEDYVIAFNQAYTVLEKNEISDTFKYIKLSYKVINFINKVIKGDKVKVANYNNKIYLIDDLNRVSSFVFNTKLPLYKPFIELSKKPKVSLGVDKKYLKDIIKRISLTKESVDFTIKPSENKILLSNTRLFQELDILDNQDFNKPIRFKILPDILSKAMLDIANQDKLIISYVESDSVILLSDESNSWFSTLKIKIF